MADLELPSLLTISQAAKLMGLSRHVLKGWVKRGVLTTIVVDGEGGTRWIPLSALQARTVIWESILVRQEALRRARR